MAFIHSDLKTLMRQNWEYYQRCSVFISPSKYSKQNWVVVMAPANLFPDDGPSKKGCMSPPAVRLINRSPTIPSYNPPDSCNEMNTNPYSLHSNWHSQPVQSKICATADNSKSRKPLKIISPQTWRVSGSDIRARCMCIPKVQSCISPVPSVLNSILKLVISHKCTERLRQKILVLGGVPGRVLTTVRTMRWGRKWRKVPVNIKNSGETENGDWVLELKQA